MCFVVKSRLNFELDYILRVCRSREICTSILSVMAIVPFHGKRQHTYVLCLPVFVYVCPFLCAPPPPSLSACLSVCLSLSLCPPPLLCLPPPPPPPPVSISIYPPPSICPPLSLSSSPLCVPLSPSVFVVVIVVAIVLFSIQISILVHGGIPCISIFCLEWFLLTLSTEIAIHWKAKS